MERAVRDVPLKSEKNMSREIDEVRTLFDNRLREAGSGTMYGTVERVDEETRTCRVQVGGICYDDVLLYPPEGAKEQGLLVLPTPGSEVILARVHYSHQLFVGMFSQVDKVLFRIGGEEEFRAVVDSNGVELRSGESTFIATSGGFKMEREGAGLKKTLTALCDALSKLTVSTSVGPSSIPINVADFNKIKNELAKYLE